MRLEDKLYVTEDHHSRIQNAPCNPERAWIPIIVQSLHFKGVGHEKQEDQALDGSFNNPEPENSLVKALVGGTDQVILRSGEELLLGKFIVEDGIPDDRSHSEDDVEHLVEPGLVHALAREHVEEAEEELRHHEQEILVEHVAYQVTVLSVSFPPMDKQQASQVMELSNSVISTPRSLLPL
jgi:hypothetical protein